MENKGLLKKTLGFVLVLVFGLIFFGCDNASSDTDSLVNVRVINETGRAIYNVRFTGSDGSVIPVEEISRQAWGNRGQGQCWMMQDATYTLSWECPIGGPFYAQMGGRCGFRDGRGNPNGSGNSQGFRFGAGQQRTIVLNADDTWTLVNS